jgi:hypothetical protein
MNKTKSMILTDKMDAVNKLLDRQIKLLIMTIIYNLILSIYMYL